MAGPLQHFKAAILDAWRNRDAADLCGRKGVRGGPLLDVHGSVQLLNSSHVREKDKALLRGVMVGGVWNGFLLGRVRGQPVPCSFCGAPDNDGHLFWECPFPPLVEIRENPEFHDLMRMDKGHWPRCLLWMVGFQSCLVLMVPLFWAASAADSAGYLVESALGSYSSGLLAGWVPLLSMMKLRLPLWFQITPMSGLMVAWFLIRLLVCLLLVLGSLLTSLKTAGVVEGGGMLMVFVLVEKLRLVEVSVLFLGLFSLFKELKCGVSFWL